MVLEFQEFVPSAAILQELRDATGTVQPTVQQQSVHFVLGNDYSFKMWNRPFKLVSSCIINPTNVNTYTIDNVRIRYAANDATAYAQGLDVLNGEFVPGTESWISFGYLKTEENSNERIYCQTYGSTIEIWNAFSRLYA
jgi:hypothetical protein